MIIFLFGLCCKNNSGILKLLSIDKLLNFKVLKDISVNKTCHFLNGESLELLVPLVPVKKGSIKRITREINA